ncbi:MAG: DUF898 family protein [Pseudomonadota bacterium]
MPFETHSPVPITEPRPPTPPPAGPLFEADFGRFSAIVVTNGLLSLPTLGFYRFWGKTRLRRYLWSHISFLGTPLEYSGQAKELLLGFLLALGFLLPIVLIPVAVGVSGLPRNVGIAADVLQAVIFLYLIQVAIFRARRYRLSRTQWRGIRAGQSGSSWDYGIKAMAWGFFALITLGLGYAVLRTRLQAYRTQNTWFGDRCFEFEGRAGELFWTWFLAWLLLLPTFGLSHVWYRVREFRYFASKTRVGSLTFRSGLKSGTPILLTLFFWLVIGFIGAIIYNVAIATLGQFGVTEWLNQADPTQIEEATPIITAINFLIFFLFVLVYGMTRLILLVFPILKALCRSLVVEGQEDWAAIAQSEQFRPGRGEGLADSLDVGDF